MSETLELTLPGGIDTSSVAEWGGFIVRNATTMPALLASVEELEEAEWKAVPKWAALKPVGDIIAPIIDDSPLVRQSVVIGDPTEFLKAEQIKFGNGVVFNKILVALPKIIAIATALKPFLVG